MFYGAFILLFFERRQHISEQLNKFKDLYIYLFTYF